MTDTLTVEVQGKGVARIDYTTGSTLNKCILNKEEGVIKITLTTKEQTVSNLDLIDLCLVVLNNQ